MRKIPTQLSIGLVALAIGGAALVTHSALAVSHSEANKSKTPAIKVPVDETPVPREAGSHSSFAPVVKKNGRRRAAGCMSFRPPGATRRQDRVS